MKKVLALLLAASLSIGIVGCGSKGTSTGKEDGDKVEIRLLTRMAGTSNQVKIYKDIIKDFEAKHPDVTVVDESQGEESSFNNKLKTDLASGTLPNMLVQE